MAQFINREQIWTKKRTSNPGAPKKAGWRPESGQITPFWEPGHRLEAGSRTRPPRTARRFWFFARLRGPGVPLTLRIFTFCFVCFVFSIFLDVCGVQVSRWAFVFSHFASFASFSELCGSFAGSRTRCRGAHSGPDWPPDQQKKMKMWIKRRK